MARISFVLVLHRTYFRTGFFDVPVEESNAIQENHGVKVRLTGPRKLDTTLLVNRPANKSGSARLMGYTPLQDWFQTHDTEMDKFVAIVTSARLG